MYSILHLQLFINVFQVKFNRINGDKKSIRNFFIAFWGGSFFKAIMAKIGHNSANSASLFFPFHWFTTIVLFGLLCKLVSIKTTEFISLPNLPKSFPLKLLVYVNKIRYLIKMILIKPVLDMFLAI